MTSAADTHRVDPEHWWTISVTAMSEADATSAARDIRERFPDVYADAVNPKIFMTLHVDRWTAQLIRDGLAALTASGRDCGNLLEEFDSWLAQADPEIAD